MALTPEQLEALKSQIDNEPFDDVFTGGSYDHVKLHHGIGDAQLDSLVLNYQKASLRLKRCLRRLGVDNFNFSDESLAAGD
jgi:hypothetical protein